MEPPGFFKKMGKTKRDPSPGRDFKTTGTEGIFGITCRSLLASSMKNNKTRIQSNMRNFKLYTAGSWKAGESLRSSPYFPQKLESEINDSGAACGCVSF